MQSESEVPAKRWRSLAHGRGGARGEEGAAWLSKGKKPSQLRARRRKLPTPPVAPRELPGVPPGLRLPSGEAAAAGEPAGSGSGDTGGDIARRRSIKQPNGGGGSTLKTA